MVFSSSLVFAGEWQEITPDSAPEARLGHSVVVLNGKAVVFGGRNNGSSLNVRSAGIQNTLFNDLWEFEDQDLEFSEKSPSNVPEARTDHAASAANGEMYVFYGEGASGFLSDIQRYNPSSNEWTEVQVSGNQPAPRKFHSAVTTSNDEVLVFGGLDSSFNVRNDLWAYNTQTNTWSQKANFPGAATHHTAAYHEGKMYVFGGFDSDFNFTGNTWEYDETSDSWNLIASDGPPARCCQGVAVEGDSMFIFGGSGDERSDKQDTWEFNFTTRSWTQVDDLPVATSDARGVKLPTLERILLIGGSQGGTAVGTIYIYTTDGTTNPPEPSDGVEANVEAMSFLQGSALTLFFDEKQEVGNAEVSWQNDPSSWDKEPIVVKIWNFSEKKDKLRVLEQFEQMKTSKNSFELLEKRLGKADFVVHSIAGNERSDVSTIKKQIKNTCGFAVLVLNKRIYRPVKKVEIKASGVDNPSNVVYKFRFGGINRSQFVQLPEVPIRWYSKINVKGKEMTKSDDGKFFWKYLIKKDHFSPRKKRWLKGGVVVFHMP